MGLATKRPSFGSTFFQFPIQLVRNRLRTRATFGQQIVAAIVAWSSLWDGVSGHAGEPIWSVIWGAVPPGFVAGFWCGGD